jgi:hypothetical protein
MAETLGSLCDKLTIIKLKQWHTDDAQRLKSLGAQERQIQEEIDDFVGRAAGGMIPPERLTFAANKLYKMESNVVPDVAGTLGEMFSQLAVVNCTLWHEQEKVYDFDAVPAAKKGDVVKQLALLNLQRNNCIDEIDRLFRKMVEHPENQ